MKKAKATEVRSGWKKDASEGVESEGSRRMPIIAGRGKVGAAVC
jgi:hypothetical protein